MVVLNAPFTPFRYDSGRSLNVDVVPQLAANAKSLGVNTVWIPGSMGLSSHFIFTVLTFSGQFETMTVAERKALAEAWVESGHIHGAAHQHMLTYRALRDCARNIPRPLRRS
jgi:dihydrodipicolinate synthase/N-acetylneuraminate lyase